MSRENVEIVEELSRCINDGDVDGVVDLCSESVLFLAARSALEGAYRGHDGLRKFFADTAENFQTFRLTTTELRDLGDRVLAIGTMHVQGRGSGAAADVPNAGIVTFEHGKI